MAFKADKLRVVMDRVVDQWFDEPVELHPWVKGQYRDDGAEDPSRDVIETRGIYVVGGGSTGSGFSALLASGTVGLSITDDRILDPLLWRQDDRVYFPDRSEWFEVTLVNPSATHRFLINLVRLKNNP